MSKIGNFFHHVASGLKDFGHDMESGAKAVGGAVESVAQGIGNGIANEIKNPLMMLIPGGAVVNFVEGFMGNSAQNPDPAAANLVPTGNLTPNVQQIQQMMQSLEAGSQQMLYSLTHPQSMPLSMPASMPSSSMHIPAMTGTMQSTGEK